MFPSIQRFVPAILWMGATLAGSSCNRVQSPPTSGGPASSADLAFPADLTPLSAFTKRWTVAEGLGPGFNEAACSDCHDQEGLGGSGDPAKPAQVISSASLHLVGVWPRQAIAGRQPAPLPADAVVNPRRGPPLFGLGLLEKISDQRLVELCDPSDRDGDGVTGHVNINTAYDNRPGRFGLQAHTSTIRDFVGNALAGEIGITNPANRDQRLRKDDDAVADPEASAHMVDLLTEYVRGLPPPPPLAAMHSAPAQAGRKLFGDIGCATCHRPDPDPVAPGAYTDLCVHKLGAELAGGIIDFSAQADEWRTAPLWGLGRRKAYLHDGRTNSLVEAIRLHGGEAEASAKRFMQRTAVEREQVLAFLNAL